MIQIIQATEKPEESNEIWSFPIEEIEYVLESAEYGSKYALYDGRLYEVKE